MPYAEIDVTDGGNVRLTYYEGAEAAAAPTRLVLSQDEAEEIHKALGTMLKSYGDNDKEEEDEA